jgi:outer membrane protein assembly factor BamB
MKRSLLLAILVALAPSVAHAAKVKVWNHSQPSNYEKAKLKQAVVSSEGVLRLSHQLKPLAGLDATHVWDLLEDRNGNLYAATGEEGKVFKIAPDGKVSVAYAGDDSQVFCLAQGSDGTIYAGTGPGGQIVKLDPKGGGKVLCDTGESYVWSLAVDPKSGALFAGTGPKGRILRVSTEGKASVFYATKQEHVLSVAAGPDGTIYAGTDKGGLVYRIDSRGKGFVLYQAPQAEVRALRLTKDGLYVGTSTTGGRRRGGTASRDSSTDATKLEKASPETVAFWNLDVNRVAEGKPTTSKVSAESKKSGADAPSTPSVGENSVYRITADGTVREVFREKALVLSLLRLDGRLLVGTGMDGQLFEVDEATRERAELARLDHGQVLSLLRRKDGSIVVGTGDPGKLYVLQDSFAASGTVTSEVLDAKLISKWGALRWHADTPAGTRVAVAVRSGNVAEPDDTWSDWSEEQTDSEKAIINAPAARFLQYRVTLATSDAKATPAVRGLSLRYTNANQAPEVLKVEVPDLNAVNLDNPKKLKIKWTAQDANEDELTYAVYVRKEGWKSWVQLEDDLDSTNYEWDTTTTPSGLYQMKIVASDRKDNPDEDALTGEKVSVPFVVCHEAPRVTVKVTAIEGGKARVEATAVSPLVRLTAASFAVNGKKWVNVFPTDGLFDSKSETFAFKTEELKPGTYVLVLRVKDAAGNTGASDVVFSVPSRGAN